MIFGLVSAEVFQCQIIFINVQTFLLEPQTIFQNQVVMDPNFDPFHPFYANYQYPVTYYDLPTFNNGAYY